jgi:ATP-dependent DNA helicase 2 subunit 2
LQNRKGEDVATHSYLPTADQMDAMSDFVDSMDLMRAGEKDDSGYGFADG